MGNCLIRRRFIESSPPTPPTPASLTPGETYSFGGFNWICAELFNDYAVLQSENITSGWWPGYTMSKFGNGAYYGNSIDGQDISDYDTTMTNLFNAIKNSEYANASYGDGLYLISKTMIGATGSGDEYGGSIVKTDTQARYYNAIKKGLDSTQKTTWFGDVYPATWAWAIYYNQYRITSAFQDNTNRNIAPAFNVDLSKINVSENNVITVK